MSLELKHVTTFGLGGPCRAIWPISNAHEAIEAVRQCRAENQTWRVLGGGSNILAADAGVPDIVFHTVEKIPQCAVEPDGTLCVTAGTPLDEAVQFAIHCRRKGMAFASGIPGTLGGAVCGNAGAFGSQMSDVLRRVEVVTPDGETRQLSNSEIGFRYRATRLPEYGAIVTRAWLDLPTTEDPSAEMESREQILALRREKHPNVAILRSAGSFFKNLPPESPGLPRRAAGKFLQEAGALDFRVGGAYVFERHANVIIAGEGATATDVAQLAEKMSSAVQARFGFKLEPEVRFWGEV